MKTSETMQQEMIADFVSLQNEITYFGIDSVARALFSAVANVQSEIWNDIYQNKRRMYIETATGNDLDVLGNRTGIPRGTASKGSVILLFSGAAGAVIPLGAQVRNRVTGEVYETKYAITLGNNPNITPLTNSLGDVVIAESTGTGTVTKSEAKELTVLVSDISGVTVTNLLPSSGGRNVEPDTEYRTRIITHLNRQAQGTQEFYSSLCQIANNTIIRTKVFFDAATSGVKIYLLKNSFASYSNAELATISNYVYANHKALTPVSCLNAVQKASDISFEYTMDTGEDVDVVYSRIANRLSQLFESKTDFGSTIRLSELIEAVVTTPGVYDLDIPSFRINGGISDITTNSNEVPRISTLSVTELSTDTTSTNGINLVYLEVNS